MTGDKKAGWQETMMKAQRVEKRVSVQFSENGHQATEVPESHAGRIQILRLFWSEIGGGRSFGTTTISKLGQCILVLYVKRRNVSG